LNGEPKLKAVPHPTGNLVKDNPSAAGKKGMAKREAGFMDDLSSTREYLNTLARPAAEYLGATIEHPEDAHVFGLTAAKDVLDRTVGKAAQELRIGPSEQAADIVKELDS